MRDGGDGGGGGDEQGRWKFGRVLVRQLNRQSGTIVQARLQMTTAV